MVRESFSSARRLFYGMLSDLPEIDTFVYERELAKQGRLLVAGTDEAGRGPLAGPVVAACVVLNPGCDFSLFKDSKAMSPKARQEAFRALTGGEALIGVGIVPAEEIDRINIHHASLLAMKKAILDLPSRPDFVLIDGKFQVPLDIPQHTLTKGESRSASIAAASIVAKVVRDEMMELYHRQYPVYNFLQHKGYPTAEHRSCIAKHGPCTIHRRSFKGVREYVF